MGEFFIFHGKIMFSENTLRTIVTAQCKGEGIVMVWFIFKVITW